MDGPRTLARPSTHCRTEHTELRCIAGGAQVFADDNRGLARGHASQRPRNLLTLGSSDTVCCARCLQILANELQRKQTRRPGPQASERHRRGRAGLGGRRARSGGGHDAALPASLRRDLRPAGGGGAGGGGAACADWAARACFVACAVNLVASVTVLSLSRGVLCCGWCDTLPQPNSQMMWGRMQPHSSRVFQQGCPRRCGQACLRQVQSGCVAQSQS